MTLKLICAAHSPLMEHLEPGPAVSGPVHDTFAQLAQEVRDYDPELVVIFGPDHFAGFLYDLMPSFCIGLRAQAMGDFGISKAGHSYNVPEATALALAEAVQEAGVDTAISYRMNADHGFAQSLEQVAGGVGRYPTIPVFINCAAPPLPSMVRVRKLGEAVGSHLATLGKRVLVIGSGGLSHDPPIPQIGVAPPEVEELLIAGHNAPPERMDAKLRRNVDTARQMVEGKGQALPLNPQWDRWFVDTLLAGRLDKLEALGSAAIGREAGVGGQEVRTWLAAFAALSATGRYHGELRHYEAIAHWNAGFGIVVATTLEEVTT
ncbi:MAG: 3-carboxyethylcatechol 2,3-dioxygenase [Pseudomonadota bacterium]